MTKPVTTILRAHVKAKSAWIDINHAMAVRLLAEIDAAHKIAYGAARSDIETMCVSVLEDGRPQKTVEDIRACWYDTERIEDPETVEMVRTSLAYLDGRGLILRHPVHAHWVRVADVNNDDGRTE